MKVTLTKDVLTPNNGVGRIGQTVEMSASEGHDYIKAGLAEEADESAETLPVAPKPAPVGPLTHDTLKENADAEKRKKKPAPGPEETK